MIVRDTLDNGLRVLTESIPHVRSVSFGVWLTRGSRQEGDAWPGIAHFVEHMLFKGSHTRSAEDIAQAVDSIGGQMDASTGKENANYAIKVLDEQLPLAVDILSDVVLHPRFSADDVTREKSVVLEEIKMVEDTPDDLVHEMFLQRFWGGHPLGKPILGTRESIEAITADALREYFASTYTSGDLIVAAAGNLEHERVRDLVAAAFLSSPPRPRPAAEGPPDNQEFTIVRHKDLEQSHICLGIGALPQNHPDRYAALVLNTVMGGSMSSRLFQNVREKRGLAYSVGSGLSAFSDAGLLSIYAGCANHRVQEVIDVVINELRQLVQQPILDSELQRAKDNVKGNLLLGLESTWHRAAFLARQEMYFDRMITIDETIAAINRVTIDDVSQIARTLMGQAPFSAAVLGAVNTLEIDQARLRVAS